MCYNAIFGNKLNEISSPAISNVLVLFVYARCRGAVRPSVRKHINLTLREICYNFCFPSQNFLIVYIYLTVSNPPTAANLKVNVTYLVRSTNLTSGEICYNFCFFSQNFLIFYTCLPQRVLYHAVPNPPHMPPDNLKVKFTYLVRSTNLTLGEIYYYFYFPFPNFSIFYTCIPLRTRYHAVTNPRSPPAANLKVKVTWSQVHSKNVGDNLL